MGRLTDQTEEMEALLLHQLRQHWTDIDESVIHEAMPEVIETVRQGFEKLPGTRYYSGGEVQFSPYMSVQWMIFLYRAAHVIYKNRRGGVPKEADQIYYLNKIMHANDWFYAIDLPVHFLCEHPLGSVLGRASYGDYLFVYQGTTVGGNRKDGVLSYPVLGDNVTLFANSTVLGDCRIGSNVVIAADTYIINSEIPDNCVVFGKSPNLVIRQKTEAEIKAYTQHIWGWGDWR